MRDMRVLRVMRVIRVIGPIEVLVQACPTSLRHGSSRVRGEQTKARGYTQRKWCEAAVVCVCVCACVCVKM